MQQEETTFGMWLRHQRHTMDLTQVELATRIGYSVVTVRKLERDALRPSRQLAERLADLFGMADEPRGDLATLARTPFSPPLQPPESPGHILALSMLPAPLTPLVGRTAEVAEIVRLLEAPGCRLLTVAGPAGVGKTRMAIEVARTLAAQVPYAIRFVALADLHALEAIVPALAEAVGCHFCAGILSPKQQLLDYLCRQEFLLVLDNVEHLLPEGVDVIQELLQRCPNLRLLVTSRERLQVSCESVYMLDGLTYPNDTPARALENYGAVKLFVETAQRARRRFVLDAGSEQDVVEICRLVDGVPLAIVLAAAWVKILTPAQIAAVLRHGPEFLEAELRDLPERQRSIKSVVAQSWHRLTAAERAVFVRLTVFRGGFTLAAAQHVAGASLPTISALVSKSLVRRRLHERYTIYELLRHYAEIELDAAGQTAAACSAHCAYYADFLEQCAAEITSGRSPVLVQELAADLANVQAARQWALAHCDAAAAARFLAALAALCETPSCSQVATELLPPRA